MKLSNLVLCFSVFTLMFFYQTTAKANGQKILYKVTVTYPDEITEEQELEMETSSDGTSITITSSYVEPNPEGAGLPSTTQNTKTTFTPLGSEGKYNCEMKEIESARVSPHNCEEILLTKKILEDSTAGQAQGNEPLLLPLARVILGPHTYLEPILLNHSIKTVENGFHLSGSMPVLSPGLFPGSWARPLTYADVYIEYGEDGNPVITEITGTIPFQIVGFTIQRINADNEDQHELISDDQTAPSESVRDSRGNNGLPVLEEPRNTSSHLEMPDSEEPTSSVRKLVSYFSSLATSNNK